MTNPNMQKAREIVDNAYLSTEENDGLITIAENGLIKTIAKALDEKDREKIRSQQSSCPRCGYIAWSVEDNTQNCMYCRYVEEEECYIRKEKRLKAKIAELEKEAVGYEKKIEYLHNQLEELRSQKFWHNLKEFNYRLQKDQALIRELVEVLERSCKTTGSPGMVDPFEDRWRWFYRLKDALEKARKHLGESDD